jgi:hypothetical protein
MLAMFKAIPHHIFAKCLEQISWSNPPKVAADWKFAAPIIL